MRYATSSLGITLLAAAVAIGVMNREHKEPTAPIAKISPRIPEKDKALQMGTSSHHPSSRHGEPHHHDHPETGALETVESLARLRLDELTADLYLSPSQRRQLEPFVLRVTPGYSENVRYATHQGKIISHLGPALSRPAFEDSLFALLDGEQQLDYAASVAEREVWWTEIIARLEANLEVETNPAQDLPLPPPSPAPPAEPTAPPKAVHRGRNLFNSEPE